MKVCSKCKLLKPISEFSKDSTKKDKLKSHCKICAREYSRKWELENKEHIKIIRHEYKVSHKPQAKEYNKTWHLNNKRKVKIYRDTKFNRIRATLSINSHRRKGFIVNITADECESLFEQALICPICGETLSRKINGHDQLSPTIDRVDNSNELNRDNVWIICHRCNRMKGEQSLLEYYNRSLMVVNKFKERFS